MSKAWIALLSAVLVALIGLVGTIVAAKINKTEPSGSPSAPPPGPTNTSPTPTRPACDRAVTLTEPENGAEIDGVAGVKVTGRVCALRPGESVWLFDYDAYDGNFYLVYDQNSGPQPVATRNDVSFVMLDQPIGDPGDKRKVYTIKAVVASDECGRKIAHTAPDVEGNYVFHPLPDGCTVSDERQILESQK
jgi:hypothetical protein